MRLTAAVVRSISAGKREPAWMLALRLDALRAFRKQRLPSWEGQPSLAGLDLTTLTYYTPSGTTRARRWEDVPSGIKETFEKLGIPAAERKALAGAGAQYDSEAVYHNLKERFRKEGVIFEDMDDAVKRYPAMVKEHFSKAISIQEHAFSSLHYAVWSGGTFIYVPKGVQVEIPLQAYFRMNAKSTGQFEHTIIIVDEGASLHYIEGCSAPRYETSSLHAGAVEIFVKRRARCRYSSVENWSTNTYNLNTKRAIVGEAGVIEWVGGNLGSKATMLYPCSVLKGEGARADHLGIAYAAAGQDQDTGAKVYHLAPRTKSRIISKSISKAGGRTNFRAHIYARPGATGSETSVQCDALIFGEAESDTMPYFEINEPTMLASHEARVGKLSDEHLYYLESRGLSEEKAVTLLINGFLDPVTRELPLEYAAELNKLIMMELEGVG